MLFDFENERLLFKHHADSNVKSFVLIGKIRVESIFYESTGILFIFINIDKFFNEVGIKVFEVKEFTRHINHRALFAFICNHNKTWDTGFFSYKSVISTESRGNMNDTSTIFGSYIIALNNAERALARIYPRDKLLVFSTNKVRTHTFSKNTIRDKFIPRVVCIHIQIGGFRVK